MGPSQGKSVNLLPSLAKDIILSSGDRGVRNRRQRGKEKEVLTGQGDPYSTCWTKGGYLLTCPRRLGRGGRGEEGTTWAQSGVMPQSTESWTRSER